MKNGIYFHKSQDFVGATVVLLSGLTTVLTSTFGSLPPSDVGLAISYALQVSIFLNLLVRFMADTEMQMNAVERVKYYTMLTTEPYEGNLDNSEFEAPPTLCYCLVISRVPLIPFTSCATTI